MLTDIYYVPLAIAYNFNGSNFWFSRFHVLPDFDEGKRSCRRKLERHNKRRRRKPNDSNSIVEKDLEAQEDSLPDGTCDGEPLTGLILTSQVLEISCYVLVSGFIRW